MIIGLSHITICTTDIDAAIKDYQRLGYELLFLEKDILNHQAKKPFLKKYNDKHSIAFMNKEGANNIELIQHHNKSFGENGLYDFSDSKLLMKLSNMDESILFWKKIMGFDGEGEVLNKISPISQMSAEILIEKVERKECFLDFQGVSCLAFFVSNLDDEISKLSNYKNIELSEKFELQVNNKKLQILLIKGPSGEMVELIKYM